MQLNGIEVIHEPFALAYYFGRERLSTRYEDQECPPGMPTFDDVTARILDSDLDGDLETDGVFVKDMAYCIKGKVEETIDALQECSHSFLIRHPARAIPSLYNASTSGDTTGWDHFDPAEAGFAELREVYEHVCATTSSEPSVIDADDLLMHPETVLEAYCESVGLTYQSGLSKWNPCSHPEWKHWKGWHDTVAASTGIIPKESVDGKIPLPDNSGAPQAVLEAIQTSLEDYEHLHRKRIVPQAA